MSIRIFHELLDKVGSQGRYQTIILIVLCFSSVPRGIAILFLPLLFHQEPYKCDPQTSDCNAYVCSLPESSRKSHIDDSAQSLIDSLGDYRCRGDQIATAQTLVYLCGPIFLIVGIFMTRVLTLRKMFIFTLVLAIFGQIVTLLSQSLPVAVVGLILGYSSAVIQVEVFISYLVDVTSQALRLDYFAINRLTLGAGTSLCALIYWLVKPWELAMIISQLFPNAVALILALIFLEQTPMDLVLNYETQQCLKVLRRIANLNGLEFTITTQVIQDLKSRYEQIVRSQNHSTKFSVLDLVRFDSVCIVTVWGMILRFLANFMHYGSQLMLQDFSENIYINGMILGLPDVLFLVVFMLTVKRLDRKPTIIGSLVLMLAVTLPIVIFFNCRQACTPTKTHIQTGLLFIQRALACIFHNFAAVWIMEALPSQLRQISLSVTSVAGRAGLIIVFPLQRVFSKTHLSSMITFIAATVIGIIVGTRLHETKDCPPPEIIAELQRQSDQQ